MRTVVIPVAGRGTRALPASKEIPKEMFPVFDRPVIQYVVEEAVRSGAENLVLVTSKGKSCIEDHFDASPDLEQILQEQKKNELLAEIKNISNLIQVQSVRQKNPQGLGHAVWSAKSVVSDDHFFVMLGDDLIDGPCPSLLQLKKKWESLADRDRSDAGVVLLMPVPIEETSKYGICEVGDAGRIVRCLEKPKAEQTKSRLAILGRYLLPKSIFSILGSLKKGALGEIQLTDALEVLAKDGRLYAQVLEGKRFDAGDRLGYLEANIHYYSKSLGKKRLKSFLEETLNALD